jgi:dTMP kinase
MRRAPFFSLDGLDGTGKSTQCALLADWLRGQGHEVATCIDPGGTPLGEQLRGLVLSHRHDLALPTEALLYMASRAQLTAEVIVPALQAGRIVVSDRYLLANVVYQGHAGGLDPELLWLAGRLSTGGLEPDVTIVLDLDLHEAQRRRGRPADRIESRPQEYHARVRAGFLHEAQRQPERIRVLDASGPVAVVQERIRQEVGELLRAGGPPWAGSACADMTT